MLFSRFNLFPQVYGKVHEGPILELYEIIRMLYAVACPTVLFCFMIEIGREECSNLLKINIFNIFSRLGFFPQVFGQVKKWLMLDLHETIRVFHLVGCPIVFICFSNRDWQGRVLKIMKSDHFFSIFNCLCPFLQVFGQVKE